MATTAEKKLCPVCGEQAERLIFRFHRKSQKNILNKIKEYHPEWGEEQGVCSRCLDFYHIKDLQDHHLVPETSAYFPVKMVDDHLVLPTPLRIDANPCYTGRGVTICMIDSGFYPHPDISKPFNRILKIVDIAAPSHKKPYFKRTRESSWHGMMTTVACAGNGFLSSGLYRGIASDANLVLLKVADKKMVISPANIAKAIHWAIDHREKYRIRIINISVTADEPRSYKESPVAQAAEAAIRAGIMVVAAVGNNPERPILPPANSPNVLSVGGLNDQNTPGKIDDALYHSSYGKTVDDFLKPELIAPAIWIAAPILPNTAQHLEAQALFRILSAKGRSFSRIIEQEIRHLKFDSDILEKKSVEKIKEKVKERIAQAKYISPHYKHADGTSFAAPIVASVIAQMLEVNPKLTPAIIREILFTTARPLPNIAAERQGYGVINAKAALQKALSETHYFPRKRQSSPLIDYKKQLITFYYHNHSARTVALAGNFNGWSRFGLSFKKEVHGRWKIEIPLMAKGTYQYKFVVNGEIWVDDPRNPHRELDGANGFNSKLVIE